jgi:hypothetical protein
VFVLIAILIQSNIFHLKQLTNEVDYETSDNCYGIVSLSGFYQYVPVDFDWKLTCHRDHSARVWKSNLVKTIIHYSLISLYERDAVICFIQT